MRPEDPFTEDESSTSREQSRFASTGKGAGPFTGLFRREPRSLPGRAASGCFVLFGLPFALAGLFVLSLAIRSWLHPGSIPVHSNGRQLPPLGQTLFFVVFGLVFLAAGLAVMFSGAFAARKNRAANVLRSAHPDEPWRWKEAWADGVIRPSARGQAFFLLFFAAIWNAISFPVAIFVFPTEWEKGNKAALFVLIFPLVGILVGWAAAQALLQWSRFRAVVFRMELPGVLGGRVRGQLDTGSPLPAGAGVELRLTCARKKWVGSGKNRSIDETILWQESQSVAPERIAPGLSGSLAAVEFRVPFRLPPSSSEPGGTWVDWRLDARASIVGPDFDVSFELPVFRTRESVDDQEHEDAGNGFVPIVKKELRRPSPGSGVVVGQTATGEIEIAVDSGRTLNKAATGIPCSVVALGTVAGGVAIVHFGGPLFVALVTVVAGLAGLVGLAEMLFGRRRLSPGPDGIVIRGTFLRLGTKVIPKPEITKIGVRIAKRVQGSKEAAAYEVVVSTRASTEIDPHILLAGEFREKGEAEWVAEEIRNIVGAG